MKEKEDGREGGGKEGRREGGGWREVRTKRGEREGGRDKVEERGMNGKETLHHIVPLSVLLPAVSPA